MNVTKRDVKVFLLGMLAMFLILLAYDWDEFVQGLKGGYNKEIKK
jgi:hypothetical protein